MGNDPSIESAIQQYLDAVAKSLANTPLERRDALLRELRGHMHEAINARTSGRPATLQDAYATLSEMDSPETYADALTPEVEERKPITKLVVLGLLCSGLQIAGLGAAAAGIPVVGAIAGFAAVVSFFVVWSSRRSPKWLVRLTAVAAICGLGIIIMEIARAV
jgi:multisubunit Na+/H+ antiporter MnhB subunit